WQTGRLGRTRKRRVLSQPRISTTFDREWWFRQGRSECELAFLPAQLSFFPRPNAIRWTALRTASEYAGARCRILVDSCAHHLGQQSCPGNTNLGHRTMSNAHEPDVHRPWAKPYTKHASAREWKRDLPSDPALIPRT